MLKNVRKSKILLSLMVGILMIVLFGNVYSLATDSTNNSTPLTITASTADNTEASANTSNTNTNNAAVNTSTINPTVSATGGNTNNTANRNTNTNNTNTNSNTSTYNNTNTTKSSNLPYTGSDSKTVLLIVVFAISAVYAYKKVSDYNM